MEILLPTIGNIHLLPAMFTPTQQHSLVDLQLTFTEIKGKVWDETYSALFGQKTAEYSVKTYISTT
ncbi:MAG: hypothetical protein QM725_07910 [Lacibacter sp.]